MSGYWVVCLLSGSLRGGDRLFLLVRHSICFMPGSEGLAKKFRLLACHYTGLHAIIRIETGIASTWNSSFQKQLEPFHQNIWSSCLTVDRLTGLSSQVFKNFGFPHQYSTLKQHLMHGPVISALHKCETYGTNYSGLHLNSGVPLRLQARAIHVRTWGVMSILLF